MPSEKFANHDLFSFLGIFHSDKILFYSTADQVEIHQFDHAKFNYITIKSTVIMSAVCLREKKPVR